MFDPLPVNPIKRAEFITLTSSELKRSLLGNIFHSLKMFHESSKHSHGDVRFTNFGFSELGRAIFIDGDRARPISDAAPACYNGLYGTDSLMHLPPGCAPQDATWTTGNQDWVQLGLTLMLLLRAPDGPQNVATREDFEKVQFAFCL